MISQAVVTCLLLLCVHRDDLKFLHLVTESGGTRSRTGGLSVSFAGPDGRVIGGGVAGMLMAASPVQVVSVSVMEEKLLINFQKRKYLLLPNSVIKNEMPSIIEI